MKNLIKDIKDLPNNIIKTVLLLLSIFLIVYAYFIFSWNISIDTELATYGLGNSEFLLPLDTQFYRLGRPILGVITQISGEVALPYFSQLTGLLLLFSSSIVWIIILKKKNFTLTEIIVFCSLYLISPIYIFQFNFINQIIGIGIGFLFSTLAIYYFSLIISSDENQSKNYVITIIYLSLSIGIYQSFIILFLEGVIFLTIIEQLDTHCFKLFSKTILRITFISLISLIIYYLTSNFFYLFTGKSVYLSNMYSGWGGDTFFHTIKNLYTYFIELLTSPFNYTYLIALLLLIIFIRRIPIFITISLIMCLFLPFALIITLATPMPFRILFSIPLSTAIVIISLLKLSSKKNILLIMTFLALFISFKQICELTYSQNMTQKYNEYKLKYIYSTLYTKFGKKLYKTPVVFITSSKADDSFYIKSIYSQPFYIDSQLDLSSNIFPDQKWQTSNINHRAYYFMRWLGLFYKLPNSQQIELGKEMSKSLNIFPKEGAIIKKDGAIFIKLSQTYN